MELEQVSRLDSGYTAHKEIVKMIDNGSSLEAIKQHCLLMMNASKNQMLKILSNERETVRKHEQNKKQCVCGKSIPSECDGNCIWDGVGYR